MKFLGFEHCHNEPIYVWNHGGDFSNVFKTCPLGYPTGDGPLTWKNSNGLEMLSHYTTGAGQQVGVSQILGMQLEKVAFNADENWSSIEDWT